MPETISPRAAPHCRTCSQPMRGISHERCRLLGDENRHLIYRQDDAKSSTSSESSSNSSTGTVRGVSIRALRSYQSPPPTPPPQSHMTSQLALRFSAMSTNEKNVQRPKPPPPMYPPAPLSAASWVLPETRPFHHANKRCPLPPASIASTEAPSVVTDFTENLRGASPGPSAIAFMNGGDAGSVAGLTELVERGGVPRPFAGPSTPLRISQGNQGRGIFIDTVASNAIPKGSYPYWPGNTPPPAGSRSKRSRSLSAESALMPMYNRGFDMETLRETIDIVIHSLGRPTFRKCVEYLVWFLLFFLASVFGGYVNKRIL